MQIKDTLGHDTVGRFIPKYAFLHKLTKEASKYLKQQQFNVSQVSGQNQNKFLRRSKFRKCMENMQDIGQSSFRKLKPYAMFKCFSYKIQK